jgi:hypothetical protein
MKSKLSVELLDNSVQSAVVNIGETGAYIEVWVDLLYVSICVMDTYGNIIRSIDVPVAQLGKSKEGEVNHENV